MSFCCSNHNNSANCTSPTNTRTAATTTTSHDNDNDVVVSVVELLQRSNINLPRDFWRDRIQLQSMWTWQQKGWKVPVEWKKSTTADGMGVYSTVDVVAGTILRVGKLGQNLIQFRNVHDIEHFCRRHSNNNNNNNNNPDEEYLDRLYYVKDYLWGFSRNNNNNNNPDNATDAADDNTRFIGMWIPGNGLNHNNIPNTIYQSYLPSVKESGGCTTTGDNNNIALVALTDINAGQELYDDYRRHGPAPTWLKQYAQRQNITLNFADCNDFVLPPHSS